MEWNGVMEHWNGILEWNTGMGNIMLKCPKLLALWTAQLYINLVHPDCK